MKNEIKLSESLRKLSKEKNISISSLANFARMNTSTLHNYFYGVCPRNILALIRIADYFDVSLDELILGKQGVSHRHEQIHEKRVFEVKIFLKELG